MTSEVMVPSSLRVVLYEGDGAEPMQDDGRHALLSSLLEAGYSVSRPTAAGAVAAPDGSPLLLLGEFGENGAPESNDSSALAVLDIRGLTPEEVVSRAGTRREERGIAEPGGWTPWFPVIDYARCTNCMQCLSFCLFDVYGVDEEGKIQVRNEDKCKTGCPACSRVCPDVAILFPKYKKGPINGDVVRAADIEKESMKVDISALLGGDIYSSLKERHKNARKRFSTERDESKALLERKRCLKELQSALDIPDEVLMTLPSAGDIEERTRRAKEKLERRKERSQSMQDVRGPSTEEEWGI